MSAVPADSFRRYAITFGNRGHKAMDLERYSWQDHVTRSDWWIAELGVTLFAITLLAAASLIEKPIEHDDHPVDPAISVPAMLEPPAEAPGHEERAIESTATTLPLIRSAQPNPEGKCEG
jgi:hypothetical protein